MIDAHALGFLLIGFARKFREASQSEKWQPSSREANEMREGMSKFDVKVINGRTWYPFEQYAASQTLIKAGKHGEFIVLNTTGWKHALETKDYMEWQNEQDRQSLFAAFPDEKEAYESRVELIKNDIRAMFAGIKDKMQV